MSLSRVERIRAKLEAALTPMVLEIRDDSALHAGHAGAQGGAGHYTVVIKTAAFDRLRRLQRHRLVYDALAEMMPNEIHALSIDAIAPGDG
jgi:BolA protein